MTSGLVCTTEYPVGIDLPQRALSGLAALLFYVSLWGALCGMAALSTLGVFPLAAGGLLAVLPAFLPEKQMVRLTVLGAGIAVALLLFVLQWQTALDGTKLLLNRFFAASEARQAYTYEMFAVSTPDSQWQTAIRHALIPLGLVSGTLCALAAHLRQDWLAAALFVLFALWVAYLGVSPATGWYVALAAALGLMFLPKTDKAILPGLTGVLLLALIFGAVLLFAPGEDAVLSVWDEQVRDTLALQTVAFADHWEQEQPQETPSPTEDRNFQQEDTPIDFDGDAFAWLVPPAALAVILIAALLLFIPAILSDWQKKRRAKNRQNLDHPDDGTAIRAMFLYGMRWLKLGGLTPANVPFSGYTPQIGSVLSPELRATFEAVLPLWQEAAYSDHPMTAEQRAHMRGFMEQAARAVWAGLDKKGRLLAKYYYAL